MKGLLSLFRKEPLPSRPVFVKGRAPTEPVLYRFRALTYFKGENGSTYVGGQVYSVRAGNDELKALVRRWKQQKKVEVL